MVEHGKPAPDLYLYAARRCGYPVADCVVVEFGVTGVTAARAAGMRVLGLRRAIGRDAPPRGAGHGAAPKASTSGRDPPSFPG